MKKLILFLWSIVFLGVGCDDFFEKDISEQCVELLVPADSVITVFGQQTLLWNLLPGASVYRLVIVTPSFERPERCLLDSLVQGHSYTITFSPGEYAWGIRAENSAWCGIFCSRILKVIDKDAYEKP